MTATSALTEFTWHPQPAPAKFVAGLVEHFQRGSEPLSQLATRMKRDTVCFTLSVTSFAPLEFIVVLPIRRLGTYKILYLSFGRGDPHAPVS